MYEQRRWLLRNPVLVVVLVVVVVAIAMGFTDPQARWWMPVPAAVIGLLLAANLRVIVDNQAIRLRYFPLWRRTIPLSTVESAQVVPYRWVRYGGWGIRLGFDGSISYSAWERQAVRLHIAGKRPVNIGSTEPERLLQAILAGTHER